MRVTFFWLIHTLYVSPVYYLFTNLEVVFACLVLPFMFSAYVHWLQVLSSPRQGCRIHF
jgi:hypothetical protein